MVLHRPVEPAALTGHVGTSTQVSGNTTNQDLGPIRDVNFAQNTLSPCYDETLTQVRQMRRYAQACNSHARRTVFVRDLRHAPSSFGVLYPIYRVGKSFGPDTLLRCDRSSWTSLGWRSLSRFRACPLRRG